MFDHPDSALHILEDMPMPSARWDKENHALWCLLNTQAKVKQLMKISSDSLVRIAYDYYKPTNNARRKAMSALYMGDINYDLGNIEEAMQYYLEGKTEVEKTDDYKTGYLIMFSLGKLYLFRNSAKRIYLSEIKRVRRITPFSGNELATVLIAVVCIALLV